MSPRAAWRLEAYGYERVYDYVAGKADWLAFNLPRQGWADLAVDHLTTDLPTCSPGDRLTDIRHLLDHNPLGQVVALNRLGIVMGTVATEQLEAADPDARVEDLMWEGPTTVDQARRPTSSPTGCATPMWLPSWSQARTASSWVSFDRQRNQIPEPVPQPATATTGR